MPSSKSSRLNALSPFLNWQPLPWQGRRKALLIGISYQCIVSAKYPTLVGPPNDVRKIRKLLMDQYLFEDDEIVMMTDDDQALFPTDLWPTRDNIVKQIRALVRDARAHDFFVFHYSGHCGQQEATSDPNEVDGLNEVLIGCDFMGLVDDDIHTELVDPLPRDSRLTATLDACHSGTMLDLAHYECHSSFPRYFSEPDMGSLDVIKHSELRFETRRPDAHLRLPLSNTRQNIKSRYSSIKFKLIAIVRFSGVATKHMSRRAKHLFTCGEKCQVAPHIGAVVISLSACRDHQITWEDKLSDGAAMTIVLVDILEKDPAITLRHLMKKLSHSLWIDALRRHAEFRKWFEKKGFKRFPAEELQKFKDDPLYGFDPQVPQLGGMRRLPMTETLMPVRRLLIPRRGHTMPISINLPSMNSPQI